MKALPSLLALSLLAGAARAQAPAPAPTPATCASVSGYVVTDGALPLAGVTVLVEASGQVAITNGDGYFTLPLAGTRPAKLFFEAVGYETQAFTATSCRPVQLELSLLPGTRIKQHGKRKGLIVKAGESFTAAN